MGSHPIIYIRADGNQEIATGHLMRCLSIARALKRREARPVFVVSDEESIALLRKMMSEAELARRDFPILHLQTDYRDLDREIPTLTGILSTHPISCLLVDSYFVTPSYLSALGQKCRVAVLDDLQAFDYPADLVINYDPAVDTAFYKSARRVLGGCAYTPLRRQFSQSHYRVWNQVKDVFLSTGGTDPFGIAQKLVRRLLPSPDWPDCRFHVLTGPLHADRSALTALAQRQNRVILHENVSDMAALMAECDLAFSAAGTTLQELCAVGVPSVCYSMADNQIHSARAFHDRGLIPYVGDIRDNPSFLDHACHALFDLARDPDQRRERSLRMRLTVDGAGADRIAEALTQDAGEPPAS